MDAKWRTLRKWRWAVAAGLLAGLWSPARGATVQEYVRLEGQGESVLQGFGIVMGLPGTGDSGKDLIVARPLAELLRSQGNAVGTIEEMGKSKSAAIVMVTCTIGRQGAKADDTVDVFVSAINNPKSLAGGELFLTPLRGPLPGQPVYAVAQGPIVIEGGNSARGRVRGGARMIKPIENMTRIGADGSISLVIDPQVSGWTTSQLIASVINDHRVGLEAEAQDIAYAVDERSVRVVIPQAERADPANFISDILSVRFDPSLMSLPARVVVNERQGVILVTGDVEISPVIITHGDLVITTVTPPIEPTAEAPLIEQQRWTAVQTAGRASDASRLEDLLKAFKTLDVPVKDQIAILAELHASGRLHADLVVN